MSEVGSQLPLINDNKDQLMKRLLIVGNGGAGKSRLARQIGSILGLEIIHLDALYWSPGWVKTPLTEWTLKVEEIIKRDSWIMDGNFMSTLEIRVLRADSVIFLDMSRYRCLWGLLKRQLQYWGQVRPDMGRECPEKVDWEFLKWVWNYDVRCRPIVLKTLKDHDDDKRIFILQNPTAVRKFVESLQPSM